MGKFTFAYFAYPSRPLRYLNVLSRDALALVQGVERRVIGVPDGMAADFEGRRHLRVVDAERLARDDESPYPLDRRQIPVHPRDDLADRLVKAGIARERRQIAGRGMLLREAGGEFRVGHDDRDEIRPAVA